MSGVTNHIGEGSAELEVARKQIAELALQLS